MTFSKVASLAADNGLVLPSGYGTVLDLSLVNLKPWQILRDDDVVALYAGINRMYPARKVIPFARRNDNDDVACFVIEDNTQQRGQVIVIHTFASEGYEVVARLKTFWTWFRSAVDEMIALYESDE